LSLTLSLLIDIEKFLKNNEELRLTITNTNANNEGYFVEYQQVYSPQANHMPTPLTYITQGNAAASRKQLLPLVHDFLQKW